MKAVLFVLVSVVLLSVAGCACGAEGKVNASAQNPVTGK